MTNYQLLLHNNAISNIYHHEDCETDKDTDTTEMAHQIREGARLMALARQHAGVYIGDTEYNVSQNFGQRLEEEVLRLRMGFKCRWMKKCPHRKLVYSKLNYNVSCLGLLFIGPCFHGVITVADPIPATSLS